MGLALTLGSTNYQLLFDPLHWLKESREIADSLSMHSHHSLALYLYWPLTQIDQGMSYLSA